MSFGRLVKRLGARISSVAKEKGITGTPVAQAGGVISSSGGRFSKIAKATGTATKMNGDTSASSTTWAVDRSFKKHKRNNIFGN